MKNIKFQYQRLVIILANNLVGQGLTRSEAMILAHKTVKDQRQKNELVIIRFYNESRGREVTRIGVLDWTKFTTPKGGRPRPDQLIFADLTYIALNRYCIRSAAKRNLIQVSRAA